MPLTKGVINTSSPIIDTMEPMNISATTSYICFCSVGCFCLR